MNSNKIKEGLIGLLQIGDKIKIKNIKSIYPNNRWYRICFKDWVIAEINELNIRIEMIGLSYNVPKNKIYVENNELFINILDILESAKIIFKIIR